MLKIFLRSPDDALPGRYSGLGVISGIYLKPSELPSMRQKNALRRFAEESGTVFLHITGTDCGMLLKESRLLAGISSKVAIALPFSGDGLKAARVMKAEGITTCVYGVRSPERGMLALLAKADYIGITADAPKGLVKSLEAAAANHSLACGIMAEAASPAEFAELAEAGVDAIIVTPELIDIMLLPDS